MAKQFSIYDAKAQLSALVRQVRESGQTFVITVHGEPVAELRPVERRETVRTLAERVVELEDAGGIIPSGRAPDQKPKFPRGTHVPGALQGFLEDRD